jgi:hypothetical protein
MPRRAWLVGGSANPRPCPQKGRLNAYPELTISVEVTMATFSAISLDEAHRAALPPRSARQQQYREYVRQLSSGSAGTLTLDENDHPITERARLLAAAKAENLNLHIQRRERVMVFWLSDEPAPTRARRGSAVKSA